VSIPNVTMRWCQKSAKCKWCGEQIMPGEAMVVLFFWNKGLEGRKWNVQICFHPQHWLDQGMDYLNRNPYTPHRSTGRKPIPIDVESKRKRFLITRRYHAFLQRLNKLDDGSDPLKALRIESQMVELMSEMLTVGGVPKKWLERL